MAPQVELISCPRCKNWPQGQWNCVLCGALRRVPAHLAVEYALHEGDGPTMSADAAAKLRKKWER